MVVVVVIVNIILAETYTSYLDVIVGSSWKIDPHQCG